MTELKCCYHFFLVHVSDFIPFHLILLNFGGASNRNKKAYHCLHCNREIWSLINLRKVMLTEVLTKRTWLPLKCKQWYAFLFLLDAPPKFRRIRWNGIKTLTWTKNLVEKVKLSEMKDRACRQSTQAVNPLQVWRLMKVLLMRTWLPLSKLIFMVFLI
jgi:hypothetical protein